MTVHIIDEHVHVQRLISVVKWATLLQEYNTECQLSVVRLFGGHTELIEKGIYQQMSPAYGASVCHAKRLHLGGKSFADVEKVETEERKWLRQ
jgi:hypothetical protein